MSRPTTDRRLRVVMGAAACGPSEEPEASAGWAFAVAAARRHDVWVVTRPRFRAEIEEQRRADPELAAHLHVEYLDLSARVQALRRHSWDLYWYYAWWQRALTRRVRRLHATHRFDVAHHVTFANDWLPCGLDGSIPLVWGPVGGSSTVPVWRLRRWLGWRGVLTEVLRRPVPGLARRVWGDATAARAAVVVAQNPAVAERFAGARRVLVEPNAALTDLPPAVERAPSPTPTALFVGRLVPWKCARLAVETMAHPSLGAWRLEVYGEGRDRAVLEQRVRDLGLEDRVSFVGHRPRDEVLAAFRSADAMLFPSFHDQAGWVVAEASSSGCPVVCLPLGGPPVLARPNDFVASVRGDVVANLAEQLLLAGRCGGAPHERWSTSRLEALVAEWYADAAASGRGAATPPGLSGGTPPS